MEGCIICNKENRQINTVYDSIGKTYYKLEDYSVVCYRHWYQKDRPKVIEKGDYEEMFSKSRLSRKISKTI